MCLCVGCVCVCVCVCVHVSVSVYYVLFVYISPAVWERVAILWHLNLDATLIELSFIYNCNHSSIAKRNSNLQNAD